MDASTDGETACVRARFSLVFVVLHEVLEEDHEFLEQR